VRCPREESDVPAALCAAWYDPDMCFVLRGPRSLSKTFQLHTAIGRPRVRLHAFVIDLGYAEFQLRFPELCCGTFIPEAEEKRRRSNARKCVRWHEGTWARRDRASGRVCVRTAVCSRTATPFMELPTPPRPGRHPTTCRQIGCLCLRESSTHHSLTYVQSTSAPFARFVEPPLSSSLRTDRTAGDLITEVRPSASLTARSPAMPCSASNH
jgi:hypothetical protein